MHKQLKNLSEMLRLEPGCRVAVIGCGGKTSLVELLANQNKRHRVLVTPTTKIYPSKHPEITILCSPDHIAFHQPKNGIQMAGVLNPTTQKLEALRPETLRSLLPDYDLVFLEADGSAGHFCKGWRHDEPVVPEFCTHTIGVVTLKAVGQPATDRTVHRLPLFLSLTGLSKGNRITTEAVAAMVAHPEGLFRHSAGKRVLLVNQIETPDDQKQADRLIQNLKQQDWPGIDQLILGSVKYNQWKTDGQ